MRGASLFSTALTILSLLFFSATARAQSDDAPKAEVGVQFTSLSVTPPENFLGTENKPGFGARFTYNLTDNVAVEAEGNFFTTKSSPSISIGGRAVQAQFGVKAGKRFERFGVYAKARPGFISFGEAVTFTEGQTVFNGQTFPFPIGRLERKTHLSVDLGGVLEFYPSRRTMVRFDMGDTIIHYGERNDVLPIFINPTPQPALVVIPSKTKHNFQFTAGVGYRFGGGREQTEPAPDDASDGWRKFEVGIQFSALVINEPDRFFFGSPASPFGGFRTNTEAGFGGRLTYNLNEYFAVEAEGNFFPRKRFSDTTAGGYPFQAQFGAKVGKRYEKFGVFAKARPGFVGFTAVNRLERIDVFEFGGQQFPVPIYDTHVKKYFSTDVGGVFEFYPSSRWLTRFDFGDTIIRYTNRRDITILNSQIAPFDVPSDTRHNFQLSAGIGYRF